MAMHFCSEKKKTINKQETKQIKFQHQLVIIIDIFVP